MLLSFGSKLVKLKVNEDAFGKMKFKFKSKQIVKKKNWETGHGLLLVM